MKELQKHVQRLQHQLEELRDKYETSEQNVKVMGLEKKEIHQEVCNQKRIHSVIVSVSVIIETICLHIKN